MIKSSIQFESFVSLFYFFTVLYAETHYTFKYFFSYLKKREPEIISDLPSRVKRGSLIPILIVIKDADKFPVLLKKITVLENNDVLFYVELNEKVCSDYKDLLFKMDSSNLDCGQHFFDIHIDYSIRGKAKKCFVDNYRGTSHKPLPIYISQHSIPRFKKCYFGETHSHTNYTTDQVEFGGSIEATKSMAQAIELDFFCATDHSYDLDDFKDNYLLNDPQLSKWDEFLKEVQLSNQKNPAVLAIPGEEVTIRNKADKNVHLLIYNSDKYFPGAGDSGEKWLKNYSELSIAQVISQIPESALAFSAHPSETSPLLQRLLIKRGSWQSEDCAESGLHGLQFINGGEPNNLEKGKNLWTEQLLLDNRLTGIAGNDAHGNFARFRQIGFPFITMRENYYHLFGNWRTGVYIPDGRINLDTLLSALKSGNCFMTNGPALLFELHDKKDSYWMGEECLNPINCVIKARSTGEFGAVESIKLFVGSLDKKMESLFYLESLPGDNIEYHQEINLKNIPKRGYFRIEVTTKLNFQALSNPIWFTCDM